MATLACESHATDAGLLAHLSASSYAYGSADAAARALATLAAEGLDRLALPGRGATLERWRALAAVAGFDLSLVKLFEGHTDALAILAELTGAAPRAGETWAVWAAEPPTARLRAASANSSTRHLTLHGTKAWCSGAACVTHALVTAWNERDEPLLAAVELRQPGVRVTSDGWAAVGMRASASVDVRFEAARAVQVGAPRAYLDRPGFWHGGAGIAACWFGAAAAIGQFVKRETARRPDAYKLAHLGAIDVMLGGARSLLRETAERIDRTPRADAFIAALRVRLAAERAALGVVEHAGRALGAAPLCRNAQFAHLMSDLPVFIRQSHAERDEAALAERLVKEEGNPWEL
jgi:hypothetical protein